MNITHKLKITGTLNLKSGLHIGSSKENVQIGGVDSPIIRRKDNNQPYIPGSSLKGKIRCLLEQKRGVALGGHDEINKLFGFTDDKHVSKLIVRDSYLSEQSVEVFNKKNTNTDLPYSEVKFENTIDRFKGSARGGGLRQIERVPAGAVFKLEFIINVWSDTDEKDLKDMLMEGVELLNNDYLGGSGTRGYGHVEIVMDEQTIKIG